MAVDTWTPAWDQGAGRPRIVAAQMNPTVLDAVVAGPVLPTARTAMTDWLLAETGHVLPAAGYVTQSRIAFYVLSGPNGWPLPTTSGGPSGVSRGREWPRQQ